jgi:hypothetical protein
VDFLISQPTLTGTWYGSFVSAAGIHGATYVTLDVARDSYGTLDGSHVFGGPLGQPAPVADQRRPAAPALVGRRQQPDLSERTGGGGGERQSRYGREPRAHARHWLHRRLVVPDRRLSECRWPLPTTTRRAC